MLKPIIVAFVVLFPALSGWAQDPFKRMDPDEWLSLAKVQTMLEWAEAEDGTFWAFVSSEEGELRILCGAESNWTLRNGDLRVVLTQDHVNISRSHNLGFNLGAKSMVHMSAFCLLVAGGFGMGTRS